MSIDLRRLRVLAQELRRTGDGCDATVRARTVAAHAVQAYWKRAVMKDETRRPLVLPDVCERPADVHEAALEVGTGAAGLKKPLAAYLLSTFYTLLLPDEARAEAGVYFTPPALTERLLDLLEQAGVLWENPRVLDPAAGGGAFLAPVAVRMAATLLLFGGTPAEILEHVSAHLRGVEIDPFSSWMARVFLEASLLDFCPVPEGALDHVVTTADTLRGANLAAGSFDVVVGNPPYGRVTLAPELRTEFSRSLYGHANLYGLFTDLAVRLTRPGGLIAYVTPSSFLAGQYYKNLRSVLAAEAPPVAIDFITDRAGVFDSVLQETVLIVAERGVDAGEISICQTRPEGLEPPCRVEAVGRFTLPADAQEPWLLPRNREDAILLAGAVEQAWRLRDYGYAVSTGPLVWNRHKPQLAADRGPESHPLIWAEAVQPTGRFLHSARRRGHAPYFRVKPRQGHLVVKQGMVLVQRTTAKEQSRRLIAAVMDEAFVRAHGGVVVENHLNMVYPADGRPRVSLGAIAALLNSRVADALFRCMSGSVAVSAFELESLPMPSHAIMEELDALVAKNAPAAAVERLLVRGYHVPDFEVAA